MPPYRGTLGAAGDSWVPRPPGLLPQHRPHPFALNPKPCAAAGLLPLTESYTAVIKAFLEGGDLDTAAAVYASFIRNFKPAQQPWQQLVLGAFRAGDRERGAALVEEGRAAGLVQPPKLFEYLIRQLCE